ncbi:VOC family protein [Halalkalibacterium halodurans]|uniref:VOC domain-containing protein n=1 Tax=Halalkalibacterium halodurans TaxID=86665 RepID=A0A0M0KKU4_ALKHA|nr:VOC family protein [Halalkalibacterium halodurans]MED3647623.1 VOC family protein [Halalkalibacterium halodurans]TPE68788.1 VOC family protein [Halalkalibacterium halodurans]
MEFEAVTFATKKLDSVKSFYKETLGLRVTHETTSQVTILVGSTLVTFEQFEDDGEPFYHYAINIPSNKLQEAKMWLEKRVTLLQHEGKNVVPFPRWNAEALYFEDPAGNIVEWIARHNLNQTTSEPFVPSEQLLYVSEVGIVTADLGEQTKLFESLGYPVWDQGTEHFRAIGDEHGLFITVTKDRQWFMSERVSDFFPLEVMTKSNGKLYFY